LSVEVIDPFLIQLTLPKCISFCSFFRFLDLSVESYEKCSEICAKDLVCSHFNWYKNTCFLHQGTADKEDAVFVEDKESICGIPSLEVIRNDGMR